MIQLNFTNLDEATQKQLLAVSKKDVEQKYGADLKQYAERNDMNYQLLLEEEAQRNLYDYDYVFKI